VGCTGWDAFNNPGLFQGRSREIRSPAEGCRRILRQQARRLSGAQRPRCRRALRKEAGADPCPHARVVLYGDKGPWKNRVGFDEIGGAVSGLFCVEGTPTHPKSPPIIPICDNVVGWLGTVGILAALRRRAVEGGSYRVTVSLTRTLLWLYS